MAPVKLIFVKSRSELRHLSLKDVQYFCMLSCITVTQTLEHMNSPGRKVHRESPDELKAFVFCSVWMPLMHVQLCHHVFYEGLLNFDVSEVLPKDFMAEGFKKRS